MHGTTQERLTVSTPDGPMQLFVARPEGEGPFPAVLVIQEVLGVNQNIEGLTQRLAGEGFVAAAPALYHRSAKTTFTFDELQDAIATAMGLDEAGVISDLSATCDHLQARPDVKKGPLGIVGFCLGGRLAFMAAARTARFGAVASFYGSRIAGTPLLQEAATIQAPTILFYGGNDPWIPTEQPRAIAEHLASLGSSAQVRIYEQAGHGFVNRPEESAANAEAAQDAWARTLELFRRHL